MREASKRVQFLGDLARLVDGDRGALEHHRALLRVDPDVRELLSQAQAMASRLEGAGGDLDVSTLEAGAPEPGQLDTATDPPANIERRPPARPSFRFGEVGTSGRKSRSPRRTDAWSKRPQTGEAAQDAALVLSTADAAASPERQTTLGPKASKRGTGLWVLAVLTVGGAITAAAALGGYGDGLRDQLRAALPASLSSFADRLSQRASAPNPAPEQAPGPALPPLVLLRPTETTQPPAQPPSAAPTTSFTADGAAVTHLAAKHLDLWLTPNSRLEVDPARRSLRLVGSVVLDKRSGPAVQLEHPQGQVTLSEGVARITATPERVFVEIALGQAMVTRPGGTRQPLAFGTAARLDRQGMETNQVPDVAALLRPAITASPDIGPDIRPGSSNATGPSAHFAVQRATGREATTATTGSPEVRVPSATTLDVHLTPTAATTVRKDTLAAGSGVGLFGRYELELPAGAELIDAGIVTVEGYRSRTPTAVPPHGRRLRLDGLEVPAGEALSVRVRYRENLARQAFFSVYHVPQDATANRRALRLHAPAGTRLWSHTHRLRGVTGSAPQPDQGPPEKTWEVLPAPATATSGGRPAPSEQQGAVVHVEPPPTPANGQSAPPALAAVEWHLIVDRSAQRAKTRALDSPTLPGAARFADALLSLVPADHRLQVHACDATCDSLSSAAGTPSDDLRTQTKAFITGQHAAGASAAGQALRWARRRAAGARVEGDTHKAVFLLLGHERPGLGAAPADTEDAVHLPVAGFAGKNDSGPGWNPVRLAALRALHRHTLGGFDVPAAVSNEGAIDAVSNQPAPQDDGVATLRALWAASPAHAESLAGARRGPRGSRRAALIPMPARPREESEPSELHKPGEPGKRPHPVGAGSGPVAAQQVRTLARSGPLSEALAAAHRWVAAAPDEPEAWVMLAGLLQRRGQPEQAARALQSLATGDDASSPALHDALAKSLSALGQNGAACRHRIEASRLRPDDAARHTAARNCASALSGEPEGGWLEPLPPHPTEASAPAASSDPGSPADGDAGSDTEAIPVAWTATLTSRDKGLKLRLIDPNGHSLSPASPAAGISETRSGNRLTVRFPELPPGAYLVEVTRPDPTGGGEDAGPGRTRARLQFTGPGGRGKLTLRLRRPRQVVAQWVVPKSAE